MLDNFESRHSFMDKTAGISHYFAVYVLQGECYEFVFFFVTDMNSASFLRKFRGNNSVFWVFTLLQVTISIK